MNDASGLKQAFFFAILQNAANEIAKRYCKQTALRSLVSSVCIVIILCQSGRKYSATPEKKKKIRGLKNLFLSRVKDLKRLFKENDSLKTPTNLPKRKAMS